MVSAVVIEFGGMRCQPLRRALCFLSKMEKERTLRLYVTNKNGKRIYLQVVAPSRRELVQKLGGHRFIVNGIQYSINDVKAAPSNENTAASMVIGGAIGLLGGVPGVIAGGALGGLLGNEKDKKEKLLVDQFNRSKL